MSDSVEVLRKERDRRLEAAADDDPRACPVCVYYHRVLSLLGIEAQW